MNRETNYQELITGKQNNWPGGREKKTGSKERVMLGIQVFSNTMVYFLILVQLEKHLIQFLDLG